MQAKNSETKNENIETFNIESLNVFNNIFDFFGTFDSSGRVLRLSGSIFETTNTNPALLAGQKFSETVFWQSSEITPKLLDAAIQDAARGNNSRLTLDFRIGADEKLPIELYVQSLSKERAEIFIAGRSVSENKNNGASAQLLFAAENAAIGLWLWDFHSGGIHATPRCNELFGLSAYKVFDYTSYRNAVHPDDRQFVDEFIASSRDEGGKYKEEFRVVTPDGSIEWLLTEGRSFLDKDGVPERMTGVVQKITEHKLAADELARVHEREKRAREEAVEATRGKDFFVQFVSHELRSPLNAIMGWAKLLLTKDLDETAMRTALETIERNARIQTKLINDLVDSARVASGRLRLEYRPTNLYDIARNSCQALKPTANDKNIELRLNTDSENIPLFGDSSRLQQVFGNLISNAIKFTPEGGRVVVDIQTGTESVSIQVSDTGNGIDPLALPHIFKQDFQADTAMGRSNLGLGLGLSIVKILVTRHGGVVQAESEGVGKGSRFTVVLPLNNSASIQEQLESSKLAERGRPLEGRSIVIVEDDSDSREVLELFLVQNGAAVRSFDSVKAALATWGRTPSSIPNVVISDLGMPDEDGFSFIQKIRGFPPESGGNVPAIALSAFTSEESRRRALDLGFNRYRTKPFEHDLLIRDLLELTKQGRAEIPA